MNVPIHVEECQGHNLSVIIVDAPDDRAALHVAADRIIAHYAATAGDDEGTYTHGRREERWTGHPHPVLIITRTHGNTTTDLEALTACSRWDALSDVKLG